MLSSNDLPGKRTLTKSQAIKIPKGRLIITAIVDTLRLSMMACHSYSLNISKSIIPTVG